MPAFIPSGRSGLLLVVWGLVSAGGYAVARWAHAFPGNDGYSALARADGGAWWLGAASYKPAELVLSWLSVRIGPDPAILWTLWGAAHMGLLAVMAVRLAAAWFEEYPASGWLAAVLVVANPHAWELCFCMNSVATLSAAVMWFGAAAAGGRSREVVAALVLMALSRIDGLAVALAVGPAWALAAPGPGESGDESGQDQRFRMAGSAAALGASLAIWLLLGRILNGQWLGLIANMESYSRAASPHRFGMVELLVWMRGAIYTMTSDGLVLLAAGGAIALVSTAHRKLLWPGLALVAHLGVIFLLGITGSPLFHRFMLPEALLAVCLSAGGLFWISARIPAKPEWRISAFVVLFAAGVGGYLGDLRELVPVRESNRAVQSDSRVAGDCLERGIADYPGSAAVVPDRLHGPLLWRFRHDRVREVAYWREFISRQHEDRRPLIVLGFRGGPDLPGWLGRPDEVRPCGGTFWLNLYLAPATP